MAAILGPGAATYLFAAYGPGGPVVAGDQLLRDRLSEIIKRYLIVYL